MLGAVDQSYLLKPNGKKKPLKESVAYDLDENLTYQLCDEMWIRLSGGKPEAPPAPEPEPVSINQAPEEEKVDMVNMETLVMNEDPFAMPLPKKKSPGPLTQGMGVIDAPTQVQGDGFAAPEPKADLVNMETQVMGNNDLF